MGTATPTSRSSASRVEAGVVTLMVAFSVMSYFDRTIMSIAGPGIIKEFALSETQIGFVYSAFILSYALLMIPGGRLADRFGPWRVLTVMGLGAGLFTALTALGGKPGLGAYLGIIPSFLIIRLGLGVCTAPLYPSCGRMIANWFRAGMRGRIWGWVAAGAGIGSATSPLLFSWMVARYGWRLSFCLSGVATAALACLWLWYGRDYPVEHPSLRQQVDLYVPEETVKPGRRPVAAPWGKLLTDRNLMLLTIGYFTVAYFEYIFFYWIYYYFGAVRHMGARETATYTSALFLTWIVMTPLGGWISDRLVEGYGRKAGRRIVPLVCLTLSAILLGIGIHLASPLAVATVLALSFGCASGTEGPFWACAIDVGGKHVGGVGGILNTGANLGGFLAPILTPFIASHISWSWALYAGSLIMLSGALAWFVIDPTRTMAETGALPVETRADAAS
jgi:MFS transporter, ACS family, glucarate transporter